MTTTILWFRDDLRLTDHPALIAAAGQGTVIPVCVVDELAERTGGAGRWWLHHALDALAKDIAALGGELILRTGDATDVLKQIALETGADDIHTLLARTPAEVREQQQVVQDLARQGIGLELHDGALLHDPATDVRGKTGGAYKVFTPFWRAFRSTAHTFRPALGRPPVKWGGHTLASEPLTNWNLLPTKPDWAGGLRDTWQVSEAAAQDRLSDFLDHDLHGYPELRDRPDLPASSRLSPYLRWGQLSPHQVWHQVMSAMQQDISLDQAGEGFLRQLAWREFSYHVLWDFPDLASQNWRAQFDAFPWQTDDAQFERWRLGQTGYPVVDAAMRELMSTGWMHNRGRMVTASFLTKHLLQDWRKGLAWFEDALVDADPALDPFGWQWVAGSGADAAPYFRIFNPVIQGEKFDPKASYVLRWRPELGKLPEKSRHKPQDGAIVDHATARQRALAAFAQLSQA